MGVVMHTYNPSNRRHKINRRIVAGASLREKHKTLSKKIH
jgi:hypothetical protein